MLSVGLYLTLFLLLTKLLIICGKSGFNRYYCSVKSKEENYMNPLLHPYYPLGQINKFVVRFLVCKIGVHNAFKYNKKHMNYEVNRLFSILVTRQIRKI